jgi:hypothetical protein
MSVEQVAANGELRLFQVRHAGWIGEDGAGVTARAA